MNEYIGTIDQGTTSSRFIIFNNAGKIVTSSQLEHQQIFPQPGWVEHNPMEIIENVRKTIQLAVADLGEDFSLEDLLSVGITNQRETVVAWNRKTGKPYYNAIVWQDLRGRDFIDSFISKGYKDEIHHKTGLIPASYFSVSKINWLLENISGIKEDVEKGEVAIGTIDSWILWNLTGGNEESPFFTDVTNASRYMLMDIEKLVWDEKMLTLFQIPKSVLPKIVPSIPKNRYGIGYIESTKGKLTLNFSGILGDQQAALFGQACFNMGQSKCTYGTGGFLLMNIGEKPVFSNAGLLTTVSFQREGEPAMYAFEGAIAVAGSLVQWIRDNLGLIKSASEVDEAAMKVEDCGGVYFVPAFAGLFAPYWRPRARGIICGLTGYVRKEHICRAVLESTAFQVNDLFQVIKDEYDLEIPDLRVDGGMTVSEPLMQIQADFLGVPVIRPEVIETTALGATYAAGLSIGFWNSYEQLQSHWKENKRWFPKMAKEERLSKLSEWHKAIERSFGWTQ